MMNIFIPRALNAVKTIPSALVIVISYCYVNLNEIFIIKKYKHYISIFYIGGSSLV